MNPQAFQELWPLGLYLFFVLALVAGMLIISALLGQRSPSAASKRGRNEPYESGIVSVGFGRFRISAHFYLVAMLFVLFDLEVVYIIAWAIAWDAVGWSGYWGLLVFVGILVAGLAWEWRMGALEWHPGGREVPEIQRPLQLRKGDS
jgi:NADH-quinone oxidoreductase subunit A